MKCKAKQIKDGEILSRISYCKTIGTGSSMTIKNLGGNGWRISSDIVEDEFYSPYQYTETKILPITKLYRHFGEIGDSVFCVKWKKKDGSDRIGVCRMRNPLSLNDQERSMLEMGFAQAIDMEKAFNGEYPGIQIDKREIKWFIYENVLYLLKGESKPLKEETSPK